MPDPYQAANLIAIGDLASAFEAGGRPATAAQQTMLQTACDVASALAVKVCNGRDFVRQVYTESYEPEQDGTVFLRQMPVNGVSRISAGRSPAITAQCIAAVARASVSFAPGVLAQGPPLGLNLLTVVAGVTTKQTVLFSAVADIGALGAAISALSGWAATVQPWASGYPCTDLVDAQTAAPATGTGADIAAYANDIPGRLDWRTGILHLPAVQLAGAEQFADPSWWPEVGGVSSDKVYRGRVLVSYDAGFDSIPADVVAGTVLIAMALMDRWTADFTLMTEDLGNTRFGRTPPEMLGAVPRAARDFLIRYRIGRV
jgi:hypothetical protein